MTLVQWLWWLTKGKRRRLAAAAGVLLAALATGCADRSYTLDIDGKGVRLTSLPVAVEESPALADDSPAPLTIETRDGRRRRYVPERAAHARTGDASADGLIADAIVAWRRGDWRMAKAIWLRVVWLADDKARAARLAAPPPGAVVPAGSSGAAGYDPTAGVRGNAREAFEGEMPPR